MAKSKEFIESERDRFRIAAAISRLKRESDDFQVFIDMLHDMQRTIDERNRIAVKPALQWGQGEAQLMAKLLRQIYEADETKHAIKSQLESDGTTEKVNSF
jgi:hypothetical protein